MRKPSNYLMDGHGKNLKTLHHISSVVKALYIQKVDLLGLFLKSVFKNLGFDLTPSKYVTNESLEKYQTEFFLHLDDILWNSTGTGTVGRANVISYFEESTLVADSHVTIIRPLNIYSCFLWYFIMAPRIRSRIEPDNENYLFSGSTNQVELNTTTILNIVVPVAEKKEQHHIVAKVDQLMFLYDQLKRKLNSVLRPIKR
jgi:type I restriction enzyme S subunit